MYMIYHIYICARALRLYISVDDIFVVHLEGYVGPTLGHNTTILPGLCGANAGP